MRTESPTPAQSFRPLIGVSFCKHISGYPFYKVLSVSVPLSGLVSVNSILGINTVADEDVSVPLSGLVSVNQNNF